MSKTRKAIPLMMGIQLVLALAIILLPVESLPDQIGKEEASSISGTLTPTEEYGDCTNYLNKVTITDCTHTIGIHGCGGTQMCMNKTCASPLSLIHI